MSKIASVVTGEDYPHLGEERVETMKLGISTIYLIQNFRNAVGDL